MIDDEHEAETVWDIPDGERIYFSFRAKTMEAGCKKRLKKEIIKRKMKWIPSTFKTIVHEPDPFNEWTTSVAVKVFAIPQKRYR